MPDYYTVVFTPSTWQDFIALPKKSIGFRLTLEASIKKVKTDDVLICYLAERMTWCGALTVSSSPYKSMDHVYATKYKLPLIVDVEPQCILDQQQEIPVKTKDLWDQLDRFKHEDHRINGWAVKVGLIRSMRKLPKKDAETLLQWMIRSKK
ncbi:hypothetical protein [Paraburkholderia eburnea]|uniref:hypothetical protein n=1 Tax=Paraburkholderia eburnea TaxID=1189126 RepID=UPI0011B05CB5|nr:hypothetical protein [Paraburkholderia eburnea]